MRKSLKFRKDPSFHWGDISLFFILFKTPPKNGILSSEKRTLGTIFLNFFWMRTVESPWSATRKKRFRNRTFIGLTRVSRVNTKKWHNFLPISFLMKFDHMVIIGNYKSDHETSDKSMGFDPQCNWSGQKFKTGCIDIIWRTWDFSGCPTCFDYMWMNW